MKLNISLVSWLAAAGVLLVAGSAFAFNILVTIAGVTPTGKGAEPIAITSFSFGVSNAATAGSAGAGAGAGAGKPSFEDLHITKVADATTPKLFLAVAQGTHIPTLVLTLQKGASASGSGAGAVTTFETITLKNVVVTSFEQEGASTAMRRPSRSRSHTDRSSSRSRPPGARPCLLLGT